MMEWGFQGTIPKMEARWHHLQRMQCLSGEIPVRSPLWSPTFTVKLWQDRLHVACKVHVEHKILGRRNLSQSMEAIAVIHVTCYIDAQSRCVKESSNTLMACSRVSWVWL